MTVFKAKVIEHPDFYRKRRQMAIAGLVASVLTSLVVIPLETPITYLVISLVLGVLIAMYQRQFFREMKALSNRRELRITPLTIMICDKHGTNVTHLEVEDLKNLVVAGGETNAGLTVADQLNELRGTPFKTYIAFQSDRADERIDFTVDSQYMMVQLKKIVGQWQRAGVPVTLLGRPVLADGQQVDQ